MSRLIELSAMIERSGGTDLQQSGAVDLHLHTYYSDGTLSPAALVQRAAERGVTTIAVTDHDGLDGVTEALAAGEREGVCVIPGIEFSAGIEDEDLPSFIPQYPGQEIFAHILGYEIDLRTPELNTEILKIREQRRARNEKLLRVLNTMGYELTSDDLLQRSGQSYIGKPNFAFALKKRGYINELREAFADGAYLRHPEAKKVHREKIHAQKAISLIREAGGTAVLAHPLKINALKCADGRFYENLAGFLDLLQSWGLGGMECRYSSHTEEEEETLIALAKKQGLVITAGSDFHGPEFNKALDIGVTVSRP
jgi:3',5'-nucleoside bisphosphate phosphatase